MPNHKSAEKAVRKSAKRRVENRYVHKTTRNAVKKLRETTDKKEAEKLMPEVSGMIDKLVKKNIIHKNRAANLKSKLAKKVQSL